MAEWVPDFKRDGYLVGLNWSGEHALGYDLEPDDVVTNVSAAIGGRLNPPAPLNFGVLGTMKSYSVPACGSNGPA